MTTTTWNAVVRSTVGRKVLVALSGAGLMAWLVLHVLGNLLVFRGPEVINGYGRMLHGNPLLLWGQRGVVLLLLVVHVVTVAGLEAGRHAARPTGYALRQPQAASLLARGMRFTGPLLLVLLGHHLLHFTFGSVHPDFVVGDVHHNLVQAFRTPGPVAVYAVFMAALGWHLLHGGRSLLFSLGLVPERHGATVVRAVRLVGVVLALAGAAIPLGILAGRAD